MALILSLLPLPLSVFSFSLPSHLCSRTACSSKPPQTHSNVLKKSGKGGKKVSDILKDIRGEQKPNVKGSKHIVLHLHALILHALDSEL